MSSGVTEFDLSGLTRVARGKVREIFDLGDAFLFVASDRISAFDCVLPNPIPDKGKVLTQISKFWFDLLGDKPQNHMIAIDFDQWPERLAPYRDLLEGRFMVVKKLDMLPVECVVRGFLVGSGLKEYRATGAVCGIPLPDGLRIADRLPEPIFTPSTKATSGHDENISFDRMIDLIGRDLAHQLRETSLSIYRRAFDHAWERGVIIADTKFEFGLADGALVLADEVLTPDSSRYWPRDAYRPGENPPSFDKQYVRDYLEGLDWDKTPPAPELPQEIVAGTSRRYRECYELITGSPLH